MPEARRRRSAGPLVAVVTVVVVVVVGFVLLGSDEPGSGRVDDALAAAVAAPDDDGAFVSAVEAIAADGADEVAAQQLVGLLPAHRDGLQSLDRPVVVDALTSVMATDAAPALLDALSGWVVDVIDPVAQREATYDEGATILREQVAPVFVAAIDDLDHHGDAQRDVTEPARAALARRIAEREGIAVPQPGDVANMMSDMTPEGDPIGELERAIHDQRVAEPPVLVWGPGAIG